MAWHGLTKEEREMSWIQLERKVKKEQEAKRKRGEKVGYDEEPPISEDNFVDTGAPSCSFWDPCPGGLDEWA